MTSHRLANFELYKKKSITSQLCFSRRTPIHSVGWFRKIGTGTEIVSTLQPLDRHLDLLKLLSNGYWDKATGSWSRSLTYISCWIKTADLHFNSLTHSFGLCFVKRRSNL